MLDHLRKRVVETLAPVRSATLSTYGPAELQATLLHCEAADLRLYFLIPGTSDHLVNLEHQINVVVTTSEWQLRGVAFVLDTDAYPAALELLQREDARWSRLVEIRPIRLNVRRRNGWGYNETIDVES